jgi:hypothetical protein
LAEEKEEDGGQRGPEKRKEPLERAPTLSFGERKAIRLS